MLNTDYVAMIAHIELGTELGDIPKDCELANMGSNWEDLSVVTIKGGKSLILKHNCEILVPKKERVNILNIAHETHLGQEMMVTQLRGRVIWHKMNADIHKLVNKCDLCLKHHRSALKDKVEISHQSMFNLWPGNTVHMDFWKYNGVDFIFIVDRLTGYIHCERTPNQRSLSAILAVKHWSNRNGLPLKIY